MTEGTIIVIIKKFRPFTKSLSHEAVLAGFHMF